MLTGYKTYITAAASAAYATLAWYTGHLSADAAIQLIQVALMGSFIRNGVTQENAK